MDMPATYAHYIFGEDVLKYLDGDVKDLINNHLNMYHIGLHGPDILFFYKPYSYNYVNRRGNNLHKRSGNDFFMKANELLNDAKDSGAACAYMLGFICHYMLDSECHPYVNKKEKISRITHNEIETEFERYLMNKNHLDPVFYKPTNHLVVDKKCAECISWFYPGISTQKVYDSINSMKFYVNLFNSPRLLKGDMLHFLVKSLGQNKISGLFMRRKENPGCLDSNLALEKLYQKSINPTVKAIRLFYQNLNNSYVTNQSELAQLKQRFERNFG
jgi:hypothetical protein